MTTEKVKKATKWTAGTILAIIIALTQLIKEVPAVIAAVAEILPSELPDTVYVIHRGKAGNVEVPDSLNEKITARMSITK